MPDDLESAFNKSRASAKSKAAKGPRRTPKVFEAAVPHVPAMDFDASMERAADAFRVGRDKIEVEFEKKQKDMLSRFWSKRKVTDKVRSEIAAGKVQKGTLGKEVERRMKRNRRDHDRKIRKLRESTDQQIEALRRDIFPDGGPAERFQVMQDAWKYHVEATVDISEDSRVINVSFTANAGDDLDAQVFLAAADYFQDDRIDVTDYSVIGRAGA